MNTRTRWLFTALAALFLFALSAFAQDTIGPVTSSAVTDIVTSLILGNPKVVAVLTAFAIASNLYQVVIAFAHKQAASTPDTRDDEWIAKLEAQRWFRVLDRIFYWGGYLGARAGGRKL